MHITENIERAIEKAAMLHQGQLRKSGEELPYITHPFTVALYVSNYTDDENTIIAALMHDTVEDTQYTLGDLARDFGETVRDIVAGVSEDNVYPDGSKKPWQYRKDDYLAKIQEAPTGSVIVSLADKIHNMRSVLSEYEADGEPSVWESISAGNEKQLWFHTEVLRIGEERLGSDNALVGKYKETLARAEEILGTEE